MRSRRRKRSNKKMSFTRATTAVEMPPKTNTFANMYGAPQPQFEM
jgi:hypothetical protein